MIQTLQILRAIAALTVVLFHFREFLFAEHPTLKACCAEGYLGVNLFFIISGFIMFHATQRNGNPWKFIGRRIIRIVPLYWLALFTFQGLGSFSNPNAYLSMFFIPLGGGRIYLRSTGMRTGLSVGR